MMAQDALPAGDKAGARPGHATALTVLVNAQAGEVLQQGLEQFSAMLRDAFAEAGIDAEIISGKGKDLAGLAQQAAEARPDVPLVVAGGDGTLSRLLPLLLERRITFGVLPLGTLNLLARDLGIEGQLAQHVAQLAEAELIPLDIATLNGIPFHSNAGMGFLSRMAREREQSRRRYPFSKMLGFAIAGVRSLAFTQPIQVEASIDGRQVSELADAVLITNNHFEGTPWRRTRLDEGLMEVHLLRSGGMLGRLRTLYAVWRGNWRELESLRSFTARQVVIDRKGRRRSTVAMDGEIHRTQNPIVVSILPGALTVLAHRADAPAEGAASGLAS